MPEILLTCPLCGRKFPEPADRCSVDGSALYGPDVEQRLGQRLGNYELEGIQGVGGMGVVYRGRHVMLGKPVAIKVLHDRFARREGALDQFLREAQAATRIRHPNIVDVTDFGVSPDGAVYFVMEFLEGISLEDVLARDGIVALFNAVNIVRQMGRALAAAHEEGIVHRDLKPENVFLVNHEGRRRVVRQVRDGDSQHFVVEKEGNFDFVKLLDFGVAKYTLEDVGPGLSTRAGMIFGTPHYMSPEQARGDAVDGRSDIYSLGIMFYEMVTSYVPFDGDAALDILNGHVYGTVIPPTERASAIEIDEGTNRTILRCLEKDPEKRFQSMDELVEALSECFTDQVFLRDAHRMPGALEAGIIPPSSQYPPVPARRRPASITAELSELFSAREDPSATEEMDPAAPPSAAPEEEVYLLTPTKAKPGGRLRTPTRQGLGETAHPAPSGRGRSPASAPGSPGPKKPPAKD